MNKTIWSILIIAVLLLCLFGLAPTTAAPPKGVRIIVQLEAPALLEWGGVSAAGAGGKIDVNSPTAQAYIEQLKGQQATFVASVGRAIPGARPGQYIDEEGVARDLSYQITLNGVTVILPDSNSATLKRLARLPGVKAIYPEQEYRVDLDVSHDFMGSAAMWAAAGGQANAGAGMKVAVLDTGIDPDHPFFDPTGFTYPPGFPKGDSRYTTPKVIVARGYYRADDPPDNPDPTDYYGHGNGTAGIAAGNLDTTAVITSSFNEVTATVSGVAPAAQVMNYQLFYTAVSGSQSAWNPEILAAIEDMVADGADVSNNSWGGVDNLNPTVDPIGIAFQNAVDAGITVVKSAGNSGPAYHSLGDTMPQSLIIVGGNDFGRRIGASASVTGPGTVPAELTNMLAIEADFTPPLTEVLTGTYVYVGRTDPANYTGCDPYDATTAAAVEGNVALISRGACRFDAKVQNAYDAGATAAIVFNNLPGSLPFTMAGDSRDIPAVMVGNQQGLDMADWEATNPATSTVEIDPALAYIPDAALPDTMYQSSSRGPDLAQEMGVDVIAPGDAVWTSFSTTTGWNTVGGTSFSGPFAAGAAAVLQVMYPTWEPWAIKSAMMSTAKNDGIYKDYDHTIHAGVLDMGAGRLQFDKMVDPGLVFDDPSLSFKQMRAGTSKTMTVMATDVFERPADTPFVYTVAISETGDITTTTSFNLSVSPSTLTFEDDGDTASFQVTMEIPADATPGDYEGWVWLRHGSHELHIPVWVRVRPEAMENHVLILDDDSSAYGFPDYLDYYTEALDAVGYTYDVWSVDLENYFTGRGFPTVAEMQAYDKIIWFTGDSYYTYYEIGAELQSRNDLFDMMRSSGARVLATGMDLSGYEFAENPDDQYVLQVGMAAYFLQEDAYAPAATLAPNPAVEGTSDIAGFEGMVFDLGGLVITPTIETGSGNQFYVDELAPYGADPELYGGKGFLRSLEPGSLGEGWVGILRSVGPTLENEGVLPGPDYRTAYLSFGLEGINDATGYNTREELLGQLLKCLNDEVSVTLESAEGMMNDVITLSADVTSSVDAEGAQYRWDFGDGSDIATTTTPSAAHLYTSGGTYTARVEVTDECGNTAIDEATVNIIASKIFLPLVAKNYTPPKVLARGAPIHGANGVMFGLDDNLYIASVIGREIVVMNPETGEILDRFGPDQGVETPDDVAFGPDGSLYWTAIFTGEVGRLSPDGVKSTVAQLPAGVNPITFSDDGRLFVALCFLGDALYEVDPDGVEEPRLIAENLGFLNGMDWGPDGFLYGPIWTLGQVVRVDVDQGTITPVADGIGVPAAVKFDSQDRLHVLDTLRGEVLRVDVETGDKEVVATIVPGLDNLAFDPQDRLYVSSFTEGYMVEVLEDGTTRMVSEGGMIAPGGVAVLGESVFVADVLSLKEFDGLTGEQQSIERDILGISALGAPITVSPDGDNLLVSSWFDNAVRVWNPETREVLEEHLDFAVPLNAIRFQGDLVVAELGTGSVVQASAADPTERVTLTDGLFVPAGLAATDDDLWVSDWASGMVLQIVRDGAVISPTIPVATGLLFPEGLAVDLNGDLLVVETGAGRLSSIDLETGLVSTVTEGLELGAQGVPDAAPPTWTFNGVAVGASGAIYVTGDVGNVLYRLEPGL